MVKKLSTKKQLHMCKKKWKKVREATEIGKSKVKKGSELLWSLLKTQIQKFFLRKKLHMCKNISRKNGKERKVKKVYFPWNIKGRETIARKIHGFWIFEIPKKKFLVKNCTCAFFPFIQKSARKVHSKQRGISVENRGSKIAKWEVAHVQKASKMHVKYIPYFFFYWSICSFVHMCIFALCF